jgi:electron transport complex protein RnfA
MDQSSLFFIIFSSILINNYVLVRFLGICPFLGLSRKTETAVGMGMAVIFVITMTGAITWAVYQYLLVPFHLEYLRTIAFILVIAALVQFVEMVIHKTSPTLYQALGIYLPLITTNCAVLGVAVLIITFNYNFIQSVVYSFGAAVGWTLAIFLMAGIRERQQFADVSTSFQGFAVAFITAALMSMAFLGFSGFLSGG